MKRSPIKRKTWLKRGKPPKRSTKPIKRTWIKRTGWIRPRPKPERKETKDGRVILRGNAKRQLRKQKHDLAKGRCEMCGASAPLDGHEMAIGNLCHWPPKGMGNAYGSDTLETTKWGCRECHDKLDGRNQKVVPKKPPLASEIPSASIQSEDGTTEKSSE